MGFFHTDKDKELIHPPIDETQTIQKNFRLMISSYQGGLDYIKKERKKHPGIGIMKMTGDKMVEYFFFRCNPETGEIEGFFLHNTEGENIGCFTEERRFDGSIDFRVEMVVGNRIANRVLNHTAVIYKSWVREQAGRKQAA